MNSKLLQILSSLSKTELKGLVLFAQNPVFNSNKNIAKLLSASFSILSKINNEQKEKEYLYNKIFPSKDYNELRFRQVQTECYQLSLRYIAHLALAKAPQQEALYTQGFLQQELPLLYEKQLKTDKHKQESIKNEESYAAQFKVLDVANRFYVEEIRRKGRKLELETESVLENLSASFMLSYLRYACQELNLKNIKSTKTKLLLIEDVLTWLNYFPIEKHPVIHVYAKSYLLLFDPSPTQFEGLKLLLDQNVHVFDKAEAYELFIYMQNYCIRAFNSGDQKYLNELFALYKESLDKELIFDKGVLSPWDYKNIVFVGLKLNAYDWTLAFLHKYKGKLPKQEQENAFSYNLARTHFAKKNYDEVLRLLNQVDYSDIFYQLDAKATLIKTYYEMEEFDLMESLIDSNKILLLRSKNISASYKTLYNNFLIFVKRISRTASRDHARIDKLLVALNEKSCADKIWVKEKLNELR